MSASASATGAARHGTNSSDFADVPFTRRLFSPFGVLMMVYAAYFALVYTRVYEYVYWELMNLGTRIIGFTPSTLTFALYVWGGLLLVFGYLVGRRVALAIEARPHQLGALSDRLSEMWRRLSAWPVIGRLGPAFTLSLIGWLVGFSANGLQVVASGRASLFDIATRWQQSPVLVWFAAAQVFFVPALIASSEKRRQKWLTAGLFVLSTLALGLLGARNLPAKLVVAGFLAVVYMARPKHVWRFAAAFLVVLVVALGVVGSVSKSGIYGPTATTGLAVGLTYSDSVGTAYNLDRIVRLTPSTGVYGGRLLADSTLALVPGMDAEYANFQLGRYLGGRSYFHIGGELIERSVSLAPTLLGAPYADWGVPGVAGQMLLIGAVIGYLQRRARTALWLMPFLVMTASYVINGVNAGVHNPHAIVALASAVAVALVDVVVRRPAPGAPDGSTAGRVRAAAA